MVRRMACAAMLVAGLAACGTDPRDRTTGGAAAGAATGAGIGALGGPVGALAGAAIGAGAGAVTGATTSPRDVNLGKPVWDNPEVRTPVDNSRRRTAARSRRARPDDAAYNGGGMVGYPEGRGPAAEPATSPAPSNSYTGAGTTPAPAPASSQPVR